MANNPQGVEILLAGCGSGFVAIRATGPKWGLIEWVVPPWNPPWPPTTEAHAVLCRLLGRICGGFGRCSGAAGGVGFGARSMAWISWTSFSRDVLDCSA
jgi:hypothetical protein